MKDINYEYMITFSHPGYYYGSYQRELYASSFNEACAIARNTVNYPGEFPDLKKIEIIITNLKSGEVTNYIELPDE